MKKGNPARRHKLGAEPAFPDADEAQLAILISLKAKWGFASTREESIGLVEEFVTANKDSKF